MDVVGIRIVVLAYHIRISMQAALIGCKINPYTTPIPTVGLFNDNPYSLN